MDTSIKFAFDVVRSIQLYKWIVYFFKAASSGLRPLSSEGGGTNSPLVEFYKRVVLLFKAYSCHRSMTAINFSIITQGEELRLNAVN